MESSILLKREYGAVCLRLREMMDRRGINRNQMARRVGVRFEVVDKWYRDEVEDLSLLLHMIFEMHSCDLMYQQFIFLLCNSPVHRYTICCLPYLMDYVLFVF